MRFAIEGQIENVGAADIFLFLSQTQRTSVVAFERPDQESRVFFVNGQPVWCVSTKVQLQIEARLAAGGATKMRDIELALERQKAGGNRIPQALIAELMATEISIEKDLRALALDSLRDVATWTTGSFTVYDGVPPPPWVCRIAPDFSTLLVEALRSQCQRESLQKEFITRKGVLKPRSAPRNTSGLSDAERSVLALVNGETTIDDIVKRSGLDEIAALSAMHVLCALHITDLSPAQRGSRAQSGKVSLTPAGPQLVSPTPAQVAVPPPFDLGDRGGTTDKSKTAPGKEAKKSAADSAEATRKVPEPILKSSESTAQLPALKMDPPVKAVKWMLRITSDDRVEDVHLTATTFAIGRHPRNDLVLKDPRISSFHCRVELDGDKYALVDLKSRNGTLLNSVRIDRSALKHNDLIQLGSTKVNYLES